MSDSANKNIVAVVVVIVLILGIAFLVYQPNDLANNDQNNATSTIGTTIIPPTGAIVARGNVICLPHKNTSGPTTLECAYGLRDTMGRYFALRDTDPNYSNISNAPMGTTMVEVKGTFAPEENEIYPIVGIIDVTKIATVK